jgi:dephospho-CoA kinase
LTHRLSLGIMECVIHDLIHYKNTMEEKKRVVIGLLGETGSGKDTVARYLKTRYNAHLLRFADPIKETLSLYFERFSKDDQQWLAMLLKERFGKDILGKALKPHIDGAEGIVSINGLRFPEDLDFVREFTPSYILYVTAPQKLRWERAHKRGEKTDDGQDFEHFQKMELVPTEVHIPEIGAKADFTIVNDQGLDELLAATDAVMEQILKS